MIPKYNARQIEVTGEEAGRKIKEFSILVVGAGAAGNEILKNLALMGFGKFTIVDFDLIEESNLSRTTLFRKEDMGKPKALVAAERLMEVVLHENPKIRGIHGNVITDLGKGEFLTHDIIISCVDTLTARAWLNDWSVAFGKPFFEIGFRGFNADITFIQYENEESPCLRTLIGYGNFDEKRNSCSGLIVEDFHLEKIPTIQSTSAVASGLLVTEIIKFIKGESTLKGKTLKFNGQNFELDIFKLRRSKGEKLLIPFGMEITSILFDNQTKVADILKGLNRQYHDYFILKLPDEFIESWKCSVCERKMYPRKWKSIIHQNEMKFDDCDHESLDEINVGTANWVSISELHLGSKDYFLSQSLSYFGIPSEDILFFQGIQGKERIIINAKLN